MSGEFIRVASLTDLEVKGRIVVKAKGKQIVLFKTDDKIHACNNRCPHEGFPLSEGSLSDGCILTCNWHNWKFNLEDGNTLVGGDQLRTYKTRITEGDIYVDIQDPPKEQLIEKALKNLKASFRRQEYDRMAREISRLQKADGDPLDTVRQAILWTHNRFEYGTTHAFGAMPDWVALRKNGDLSEYEKLVPLVESIAHMSWDIMQEETYPFTEKVSVFNPTDFVEAIEEENEETAISLLNHALQNNIDTKVIINSLARAALKHYAGFGHSAIYVYKAKQAIEELGEQIKGPLLKALVRNLIYARREDLLPEFRQYASAIDQWDSSIAPHPSEEFTINGASVNGALSLTLKHAGKNPEKIYTTLLKQLAQNMLFFNMDIAQQWNNSVSNNVSWLNFSHGITFANAVRNLCENDPGLWPSALLQMACFVGRNKNYIDFGQNVEKWSVSDSESFFKKSKSSILDHANPEFIVSAHLIKLITAVEEEYQRDPESIIVPELLAATNRFLHSPFKRKHTLRTAYQSMEFVEREG